jgi:N-acyl homoserine lactone hydrolase
VRATDQFKLHRADFSPCPGVRVIETFGHTRGHVSVFVELGAGPPIVLAGDAADLAENIEEEIAPGLCYEDDPEPALASIRKLEELARSERAWLWPNHDIDFFRKLRPFPGSYP